MWEFIILSLFTQYPTVIACQLTNHIIHELCYIRVTTTDNQCNAKPKEKVTPASNGAKYWRKALFLATFHNFIAQ
jgi:hypothetical protein